MHRLTGLAGMAMLAPGAAMAQSVPIVPGQELVLTVREGGGAQVIDRRILPLAEFDPTKAAAAKPEPEKLRIRFLSTMNDSQSLLVIENGYDRPLAYRAEMSARGTTVRTSVCLVLAGKLGFEHWPYLIEQLRLSDFQLRPATTPISCE